MTIRREESKHSGKESCFSVISSSMDLALNHSGLNPTQCSENPTFNRRPWPFSYFPTTSQKNGNPRVRWTEPSAKGIARIDNWRKDSDQNIFFVHYVCKRYVNATGCLNSRQPNIVLGPILNNRRWLWNANSKLVQGCMDAWMVSLKDLKKQTCGSPWQEENTKLEK